MNTDPYSILADKLIADNCSIVRWPDKGLCALVPLGEASPHSVGAASTTQKDTPPPEPHVGLATAELGSAAQTTHAVPAITDNFSNWTAKHDAKPVFSTRTYKFVWKSDTRTKIELWDHLDGYGTVRRWVKPKYGRTIKDMPLYEQPIIECWQMIGKWMKEGPYSWTRYDQPISPLNRERVNARRKVYALRQKLLSARS
jgi:hypothetical protein